MANTPGTGGLTPPSVPYHPGGAAVSPGTRNVIRARQVIVSGANGGVFLYSGTPGPGNPPVLWEVAPGTTVDPFGNALPAGQVFGAGVPGGQRVTIDASGNVTLTGVTGSQLSLMPAAALPFSLTAALTGVMQSVLALGSGDGNQAQAGVVSGITLGSGSSAKMGTLVTSPFGATTAGGMGMLLEAQNDGGTDQPGVTFGTVTSQGGTLTFQPVLALLPYAMLLYGATGALTVVTVTGNTSSTVSGTIPIPGGVTVGYGEAWGPGAGGPNGDGSCAGSAGAYSAEPTLALTGGGTAAYSIPAAGTGASSASSSPLQGTSPSGPTTLAGAAVTVTANPGSAGTVGGPPATGGAASGNTISFKGGDSGPGSTTNSGGGGGGSSGGPGGPGNPGSPITGDTGAAGGLAVSGGGAGGKGGNGQPKTPTVGSAGATPGGGGGSGGFGSSPYKGGGNGGAGRVRLTYLTGAPTILASFASAAGTDQFGTAYSSGNVFAQPIAAQVSGLADTWHQITVIAAGLTINSGGHIAYRKTPENMVEVEVLNCTTTSTADGTTIVTSGNGFAAGWRPLNEKRRDLLYANAKSTVGAYPDAGFAIQTDGSIQCYGFPASTRIDGQFRFPLDI